MSSALRLAAGNWLCKLSASHVQLVTSSQQLKSLHSALPTGCCTTSHASNYYSSTKKRVLLTRACGEPGSLSAAVTSSNSEQLDDVTSETDQAPGSLSASDLLQTSERAVLESVAVILSGVSATFYCGGNVPLVAGHNVRIYFEKTLQDATSNLHVIQLPQDGYSEGTSIDDLAGACVQATFGKAGSEDEVLDPEYRKALKLDPAAFSCSFQVAEHGILHAIEKLLTPNGSCIRAELHKLNIYKAGDFFKAHVDTPRGPTMFGSLVVCLPSVHEGGNLIIRHGKQSVNVDWSEKSADHIQWVALYSDCEHEVTEVLSGNRVTLTYNLYVDPPSAPWRSPLKPPLVDLKHTALYQSIVEALRLQSFMHDGGVLGLTLQHKYPHVSNNFVRAPAAMLKGADAMILAVADQLGLQTRFVHLYSGEEYFDDYAKSDRETSDGETSDEEDPDWYERTVHILDQLDVLKVQNCGFGPDRDVGPMTRLRRDFDIVSDVNYDQVTWCLKREDEDLQEAAKMHATYGNEPEVQVHYSVAALLVTIPAWGEEREKILEKVL